MKTTSLELRLQAYGIALLRVALGAVFVAHGAQKLFTFGVAGTAGFFAQAGIPFPAPSATLVIGTELIGGLALLLGLSARLVSVPLAVVMLVAMLTVHLPNGFFLPQGAEFTVVLLAGLLALVLAGPGAFALDRALKRSPEASVLSLLERRRPDVKAAA